MAENSDLQTFSNILHFCKDSIIREVCKVSQCEQIEDVSIIKRNKDLKRGDFVSIIRRWKNQKKHRGSKCDDVSKVVDDLECQEILHVLSFDSLAPFQASVVHISEENDIYISLKRPYAIKSVVTSVCRLKEDYGRSLPEGEQFDGQSRAYVNVAVLSDNADWPGFSLNHLRSLLLSNHITRLLEVSGYEVHVIRYPLLPKWGDDISEFCLQFESQEPLAYPEKQRQSVQDQLKEILHNSRYLDLERRAGQDVDILSGDLGASNLQQNLTVINLKDFLKNKELTKNFDKNIHLADFSEHSDRLYDLTNLELYRRNAEQRPDVVVHVAPHDKSFYMQTLDIGWKIICEESKSSFKQVHLVHGPVSCRGGQIPVFRATDLLGLRRNQMTSASLLKYGDVVQGPGWDATIDALTLAGIKFELLSTTSRHTVKLDLSDEPSDSGIPLDSGGGVFVMYNCARLATLFANFNKGVSEGMYPDLPSVESLDFSLLRAEEEWALVFNYLLPYPSLVSDCVAALHRNQSPKPQVHCHKVAQFLQDLSRDLSSYYSHTHVLAEPYPHLFALMHCRLYLLKALQQVMHNALGLLAISPLKQL